MAQVWQSTSPGNGTSHPAGNAAPAKGGGCTGAELYPPETISPPTDVTASCGKCTGWDAGTFITWEEYETSADIYGWEGNLTFMECDSQFFVFSGTIDRYACADSTWSTDGTTKTKYVRWDETNTKWQESDDNMNWVDPGITSCSGGTVSTKATCTGSTVSNGTYYKITVYA